MKRDPNCTDCALHETAQHVCLLGTGPQPCDIMIIGEAPGKREDASGKAFVGKSGRLLDELLEEVGLDRKGVFITNAVSCRPPDNRTPKKNEIVACRRWLDYQIALVQPKYVLLLGNVPLQSLLGLKGIKKYRGRPVEWNGMIVLPTYHPAFVLRGNEKRDHQTILQDFRRFKDIVDHGGIPKEEGLNPHVVNDWQDVDDLLHSLDGVVSIDLETTCLYPWAPEAKIVTIGFGTASGEYSLFIHHPESPWKAADIKTIIGSITTRLGGTINVFQNGKFDCLWMLVHFGVHVSNDFDTMLAHYLVDENSRHDLETLAGVYFGAHPWDIPLEEKQGGTSIKVITEYHAKDLFYTRKLYYRLKRELAADPGINQVFRKILMPAANLFVEMEYHGCYIDQKRHSEAEKILNEIIETSEKSLSKWGKINWASPKQVGELLYGKLRIHCPLKTKTGANSTSESALKQIDHPCVADLLRYRGAKQQLSFFVDGWKPFIVGGRIHPSFKLHGTVTGRISCEHPNFQQVPRDTRIRSQITAPPGYVLLEADLSQIELRIVAEASQDPAMMEAFRNETDVHWLTALRELERGAGQAELVLKTARHLSGNGGQRYGDAIATLLRAGPDAACEVDKSWKEFRKKAKAVNFGYVYGMWWKKFILYCRDNFDMKVSEKDAQESRSSFFDLYARLEPWHRNQQRFARQSGFVRSLFGRKRRLPAAQSRDDTPERGEALRQAINSPIQSCASDLNLITLLQMAEEFPREIFMPIITVHDAILAEVRVDKVEEVVERIEAIMRKPKLLKEFGIKFTVPICGDTKVGAWGSGVSIKKWKSR